MKRTFQPNNLRRKRTHGFRTYFFHVDRSMDAMKEFTFPKSNKIKAKKEFQNVYEKGHSVVDGLSVFYVLPGENEKIKIGFAVGKKVGNAVIRNHIKRMMREVFRMHKAELKSNFRVIWVARKRLAQADYKTYERVFLRLAKRAALLQQE